MSCDNENIESLKLKLKNERQMQSSSTVLKSKISTEREVLRLRNKERSLSDDLNLLKGEIECLSQQLEMLKTQLTQSKQQISLIEICKSSEDVKIGDHVNILNEHLEGFKKLFDKEQRETELRIKAQRDKEMEQMEVMRQKEMQITEENEKQERKVLAIEAECEVIEQECAVLKKRNHAILLKLRKKLLEAENLRRQRMNRFSQNNTNTHE